MKIVKVCKIASFTALFNFFFNCARIQSMLGKEYRIEDDIFALATPALPSALALFRTSGDSCIKKIASIFSNSSALLSSSGNSIIHGKIGQDCILDDVILLVYRSPKSYTGEDSVEISCHGSLFIIDKISNLLKKIGFRQADRGEFTLRAFVNGKKDLTQAEAVTSIINANSSIALISSQDNYSGALKKEVEKIKTLLVDTLASIDVEVEYPEDEHNSEEGTPSILLDAAITALTQLLDSWKCFSLYQEGVKVVLAGLPNAGKSSLFNLLIKKERSIVSEVAGTTRDYLDATITLQNIPLTFYDTAGLCKTTSLVEKEGVSRAKMLLDEAALIVYVKDINTKLTEYEREFLINCKAPILFTWNKCDIKDASDTSDLKLYALNSKIYKVIKISVKENKGLSLLQDSLVEKLKSDNELKASSVTLSTERQRNCVEDALKACKNAKLLIANSVDMAIEELEEAIEGLKELTGEVTSTDILNSIFSNFCVGK